jgi:EmrB/QacA subfamily drug resistance transporter
MSTPSAADAALDPTIHDPGRRRLVLVAVCIALMAVIASVSGLNVAQPQVALALDASQSDVLWMINIYTVALAALLLPLGALGDRWGRRPVLLWGLLLFGLASAAAGLAPTTEVMLAARLVTGVGAAMIMPVTLAVITSTFPDEERSRAIGVWTAVAAGGGIIGMYLSALLVDVASWRWLFVLPVALVLVAGGLVWRSVPDSREEFQHPYDIVGALSSAVAILGLVLLLHEGPHRGWGSPLTVLSGLAGLAGIVWFVRRELRAEAPLLDVRLFRHRGLASGSTTLLVVFGVQAGIFVVLYPYFQAVLGWSGLRATVALMPMAVLMMLSSGLAPRVAARVGARRTMATGIALGLAGAILMAVLVSVEHGYLSILPGMAAMGLGMGLSMTPSTEAITSALPRERQGVASALNDVTRELGTALGVALLGAVLTAGYSNAIDARLGDLPLRVADQARGGVAGAMAVADGRGDAALAGAAQEAFVTGWQQAMWSGAAVLALLLVQVVLRGPRQSREETTCEGGPPPPPLT